VPSPDHSRSDRATRTGLGAHELVVAAGGAAREPAITRRPGSHTSQYTVEVYAGQARACAKHLGGKGSRDVVDTEFEWRGDGVVDLGRSPTSELDHDEIPPAACVTDYRSACPDRRCRSPTFSWSGRLSSSAR
jgi:hypothetical protein